MNKIINVNLGGYPFTMDDNAYAALDQYMDTIKKHFVHSDGCDEIIIDIEARIAELFTEILKTRQIVSLKDVNQVIGIMGRPEEFGGESMEEPVPDTKFEEKKSSEYTVGKRLYRDLELRKVGGVCAGISAYLGIEDPLWVRLAFVLSFFAGGFGVLIYAVLWMAIPEAKTAADRLAMKGEKINIHNIASTIEQEMEKLSETINEMTKDFGSKKKV